MAACAVAKGLFLGSQAALEQVAELGITHVLSVVNYEVIPPEGVCHWQIKLEDAESANLLCELPAAVTWLERAMRQKGSRVLVHCNAGTSRSPSVVLAAIMRAKGLSLTAALEVLRSRSPHVAPNPGFMAQLELWGEMGYQIDETHPGYKQFLLDQVAAQYEEEGWVDPASFAELPEDQEVLQKLTRYRCRKCRQLILTENNVIPQTGVGRRIFRREQHRQQQQRLGSGSSSSSDAGSEQGSLFCEPMCWMQDQVVGAVQGKLYCTNCNARLGSFNWAGITNSSGAWIVPGFQLHLSRLDIISVKQPQALAAMRHPAVLAECKPPLPAAATAALVDQQQQQQQEEEEENEVDFLPDPQTQQQQHQVDGIMVKNGSDHYHCCCHPQQQQQQQIVDGLQQLQVSQQQQQQQQQAAGGAGPVPWFHYLVLDCDGILVDTEAASCEALRRAILQVTGVDIPHSFPEDYYDVFGMDVPSCVRHYKKKLNRCDWVDESSISAAVQAAKEVHYHQLTAAGIQPLPGAAALIQQAKSLYIPVGVGSSGAPSKIHHNLKSSRLISLLDPKFIVSASEVHAGKPDPAVYLEVLRRLGCEDHSRALIVEDTVHGLVAAKAAGAFTVGITNTLPGAVLQQHADLVLTSLEQLDLAAIRPSSAAAAAAAGAE